jgi:hypothetical protein
MADATGETKEPLRVAFDRDREGDPGADEDALDARRIGKVA